MQDRYADQLLSIKIGLLFEGIKLILGFVVAARRSESLTGSPGFTGQCSAASQGLACSARMKKGENAAQPSFVYSSRLTFTGAVGRGGAQPTPRTALPMLFQGRARDNEP